MGFYEETIARGAFERTLASNPDVVLNMGHGDAGSGLPIARTTAGNLHLSEDYDGLQVDADLDPEDPDVQLLSRKMKSGNLDGQMSFCFAAKLQSWDKDFSRRRITECDINRGDVSVVTQGANPATLSSLRNLRSALAAAGGRAATPERKAMAEQIGSAVIVEMRSFVLDGTRYDVRTSTSSSCARCGGDGSVTITCPQCKGDPHDGDEALSYVPYDFSADHRSLGLARVRAKRYPPNRAA
jgi:HK97 family phage prohead protease